MSVFFFFGRWKLEGGRIYLLAVSLPSTETLEVLSAELTGDMFEIFVQRLDAARDPLKIRCHVLDFVRGQILPVLGVEVAPLAIEVIWVVFLVQLHGFQTAENVLAPFLVARKFLLLIWHAERTASDDWVRAGRHG